MKRLRIIEGKVKPIANPPAPAVENRKTFVVSFDWGENATAGMLNAIRSAGYHAATADRFPRTTLIVRTSKRLKDTELLEVISDNLLGNGSAIVARRGGPIYVWPDQPWQKDEDKEWRAVTR